MTQHVVIATATVISDLPSNVLQAEAEDLLRDAIYESGYEYAIEDLTVTVNEKDATFNPEGVEPYVSSGDITVPGDSRPNTNRLRRFFGTRR